MEDIYEVERDEYVGFLGQLNKEKMNVEETYYEDSHILKVTSKKTNKHLCTRFIDLETGNEKYFIYDMPDDDERIKPKAIMKVTLEDKEQVQNFLDALSQIQQEAHKHD